MYVCIHVCVYAYIYLLTYLFIGLLKGKESEEDPVRFFTDQMARTARAEPEAGTRCFSPT